MKQNRVPVFWGLYIYFQLRYKIEKSAYLYKLEKEKFEKTWSTWSGFFTVVVIYIILLNFTSN